MQLRAWTSQSDALWTRAVVVAAAIGLTGVIAADGSAARLEVALTAVTLAGFVAKGRWTHLPPALLAVWTFSPPFILNVRERGEGTMSSSSSSSPCASSCS